MTKPKGAPRLLLRFDRVERMAHWANATLFLIVMLTAIPLYVSSVAALIGRRALIADIHTYAGVSLPVPLLISLAGPWGRRMRADFGRFNRWNSEELAWLRSFGREKVRRVGKFNPGQKLNAAATLGFIVIMVSTGSIMHWFNPFPLSWRTGATFVHDVVAWAIFVVVAGHITLAVTHRDSLRSMIRGWVTERWAKENAPAWFDEEKAAPKREMEPTAPR